MVFTIQGEQNPARFAGMLMRWHGLTVNEAVFERLAKYCDEPVTDGFSVAGINLYEALAKLCRDSGCGMLIFYVNGEIIVEPSDPLQNTAARDSEGGG